MAQRLKEQFLQRVTGPVFPIPTPFTSEGAVDVAGLEKYTEFLIRSGAKTVMVTVGTSRFDVLTTEEMHLVNKTVCQAVAGRAVVIVTTPTTGPTSQAAAFARHAADCGSDAILGVYPERYYTDEQVYEFFQALAQAAPIGVMIHLKAMMPGRGGLGGSVPYSPDLVNRLAGIENLVGMKEESHDQGLIYRYNRDLRGKMLIIGGAGGMRACMSAAMWGQPAYLVGIGNFMPDVELAFWNALSTGDRDRALTLVHELEAPFFQTAIPLGWHVALKEAMSFCGLMEPWERAPMAELSPEGKRAVRETLECMARTWEALS